MKKVLTLAGDATTIFKLQDVNLLLNNFWSLFRIWKEVLPKSGKLTKIFLLSTIGTITLGVCSLLRNDLILETKTKTFLLDTFETIALGVYILLRNDLVDKSMKIKG